MQTTLLQPVAPGVSYGYKPHPNVALRDALLHAVHQIQASQQFQASAMQTQQAAQGLMQSHAQRLAERGDGYFREHTQVPRVSVWSVLRPAVPSAR